MQVFNNILGERSLIRWAQWAQDMGIQRFLCIGDRRLDTLCPRDIEQFEQIGTPFVGESLPADIGGHPVDFGGEDMPDDIVLVLSSLPFDELQQMGDTVALLLPGECVRRGEKGSQCPQTCSHILHIQLLRRC